MLEKSERFLKKAGKKVLLTGAALCALWSIPAFAEDKAVSRVQIDISPDEDLELESGKTYAKSAAVAMDSGYEVSSYSIDGKNQGSPKKPYTYTISVKAEGGSFFDDETVVEVRGAYEMAVTEKSKSSIKIKANAYPFTILKEPQNIKEDGGSYSWDKVDYANGYDVVIYYNTKNGDDKVAKKSVTGTRINVKSYSEGGKEFDHIAVRAKYDKKDDLAQYIADSQYVDPSGDVDSEYSDDGYIFNLITLKAKGINKGSFKEYSAKKKKKTSSEKAKDNKKRPSSDYYGNTEENNGSGGPSARVSGWRQNGEDWYFEENGQLSKGWKQIKDRWYFFDEDGKMLSGWRKIGEQWYYLDQNAASAGAMLSGWAFLNNQWYYLEPKAEGQGKMLTGWQEINGQWYYFQPESGAMLSGWQNIGDKWYFLNIDKEGVPAGAMLKDTVQDGYTINAEGVRQ